MSLPDNTQRSLGRMEGKMDSLLISIAQIGTSLSAESAERKAADGELDLRVRSLEDVRTSLRGPIKMANVIWIGFAGAAGAGILKLASFIPAGS